MKKILNYIVLGIILFEIIMVSQMIKESDAGFCSIDSCNKVQNSVFGSIFGIKVTYIAIIAFFILLFLFLNNKKYYNLATYVGIIIAIYFIFVQFFVINQICKDCMIVDSSMIILFVLSFLTRNT